VRGYQRGLSIERKLLNRRPRLDVRSSAIFRPPDTTIAQRNVLADARKWPALLIWCRCDIDIIDFNCLETWNILLAYSVRPW
jgi:hypothetical protein